MPYYLTSSRQKNPHLVLITIALMARACRRSLRRFGKVNEPRELASRVRRRMALDEVDDRVGQTSPPTSSRPLPSQTGGLEQKAPNELSGKIGHCVTVTLTAFVDIPSFSSSHQPSSTILTSSSVALSVRIPDVGDFPAVSYFTSPIRHTGDDDDDGCFTATFVYMLGQMGRETSKECVSRCDAYGSVVEGLEVEEYCSITMPDNPYREGNRNDGSILPCQIEIQTNCTNYCHVQLHFSKFQLTPCHRNLTNTTEICDMVHSCEYLVLHERGVNLVGKSLRNVTHFHGYKTNRKFESLTDKILLQFCYRSETFSGRNIQIKYRAVDPTKKPPFYIGPISVYILGCIVIMLAIGIGVIRWCPAVKYCLEPPEDKQRPRAQNV
ncbi:hypothetical protein LSH36_1188g00005 [Paralvinella palmiformis]|uniref:Uncharacterized protein n=1 Tax=Paralvinella palmiformis TaxID=53620 RepID=A0AAD9MR21_9ANNE|nr:hypothetical protein LSH36_1188g00005 [Paralvinella palmiformis]